jgi:hypothetical protein
MSVKLKDLVLDAKAWMSRGVWNPDEIFLHINRDRRNVHYATIRHAIHVAKSEIYN